MDRQERAARLGRLLTQIAPESDLGKISLPERRVSEGYVLEGQATAADPTAAIGAGLQKVADRRSDSMTDSELYALEAIVLPENRPVVFVRGESYDPLAAPWTSLNEASIRQRLDPLLPLIGRIEVPNFPLLPFAGTGFVVGEHRLMTNRHVAALFCTGLGTSLQFRHGDAAINFKRYVDSPESDQSSDLIVRDVEIIHPYWDMAVLLVDGLPAAKPLTLSVQTPEELVGRDVVVIGYPAQDYRGNLELQDRIFERIYNVKRLQPGKLRERSSIRSFESLVNAMVHDSSTLGGNSGSAIIDVQTGQVVGLHFAGEYLKANYAVPTYELARDSRLAGKLNFEHPVASSSEYDAAWRRTQSAAPASVDRPAVGATGAVEQRPAVPADTRATLNSQSVTWSIPLSVTVTIGLPVVSPAAAGSREVEPRATQVAAEEGVVVDPDYSNRQGYDPGFLGDFRVVLPRLSAQQIAQTAIVQPSFRKHEDPYELAYHHYSVYVNKARRTAWFSAANVDGEQRPNIGKRQGDRWYADPRIAKSAQLGQEAFEPGIDRGHLTRREDAAWGSSMAAAVSANNDTFHFTNCSLQASLFNRGKDRWQGLERFLLEQHAKKDKRLMTVITGPVFGSNDPGYRNDEMDYTVRCPLQFWKVCVLIRENGTPAATAFILGQEEIQNLPGFEETFDVAATQIRIADLQKRTGLDFGSLWQHDHFAQNGPSGTLELAFAGTLQPVRPIRSGFDIIV